MTTTATNITLLALCLAAWTTACATEVMGYEPGNAPGIASTGTSLHTSIPADRPVQLSAALRNSCALFSSGRTSCWGENRGGAVGDGTSVNRLIPARVAGLTDAIEVGAGHGYGCALRASGGAVCWGTESDGQLGNDPDPWTQAFSPVAVSGLSDAIDLGIGPYSSCAVRASGRIACWGYRASGVMVGGMPVGEAPVPLDADGVTGAIEAAVGTGTAIPAGCVLKSDGKVSCWTDATPPNLSSIADAREIVHGAGFACARRTTGQVLCWGRNSQGQLGDGTTSNRNRPVAVRGLTNAVQVSAFASHACAVRASGQAVCWGANSYGQLGDGTTRQRLTPVTVVGLTNAAGIAAGERHTCALQSSGQALCWGTNSYGQLGDGTTVAHKTAAPVIGL